jgi:hypothetical protein
MTDPSPLEIRPLQTDAEAEWCARTMAASEPWITLGRGYEDFLRILRDATREVYVAHRDGLPLRGFSRSGPTPSGP